MSSKNNNNGECLMHLKSGNIEIMINGKADENIEELFQSLLSRYRTGLETSMKGSDSYLSVFIYYIINTIK